MGEDSRMTCRVLGVSSVVFVLFFVSYVVQGQAVQPQQKWEHIGFSFDGEPIFKKPDGSLFTVPAGGNAPMKQAPQQQQQQQQHMTMDQKTLQTLINTAAVQPGGLGSFAMPTANILNEKIGTLVNDRCYIPPGRSGCAPYFVIAGAMKSGSTSIFSYLLNHPNVLPLVDNPKLNGKPVLANKEVRFFNDPTYNHLVSGLGIDGALNAYWDVFPEIDQDSDFITGESSPMYICQPGVAQRLHAALPYAKVILVLRNPVDRLHSEHWFKLSLLPRSPNHVLSPVFEELLEKCSIQELSWLERCGFDDLTELPTKSQLDDLYKCYQSLMIQFKRLPSDDSRCQPGGMYEDMCRPVFNTTIQTPLNCNDLGLRNSLYALQIAEWVDNIPESQLMVLSSEELFSNPDTTMERIAEFLGIDDSEFDWSFVRDNAYNIVNPTSSYGKTVSTAQGFGLNIGKNSAEKLKEKYPPMAEHLRERLARFFKPHNKFLYDLIGEKFVWDD